MIMCKLNNVFIHSGLTVVFIHPVPHYSFFGFGMRIIPLDKQEYDR